MNGVSQSVVALTRAIAPVLGGALWQWGVSLPGFPLHHYIPFAAMAVIATLMATIATRLPSSLNLTYPEEDEA